MIAKTSAQAIPLRPKMENLLARHGTMPVIWALARALLKPPRRRARPPDVAELNAHLRRDIGLPAKMHQPHYWDHMR
ncbi:hypothetical protein H4P12_14345 [Paracoccus sp. 11-3]|uniref:DUF1127 domain-containing protein n=1 Tax=Paracoccus amoyensis TaxID=2760093 RepID=A0A926GJ18_9RHOB|nr:hypothetical protein [Paracoccus amoyensis]MBC9247857.1 hypothetical protein [Paracoccus amoyensis]